MDKLYLGQEDDKEVDDLLAQLGDEGLLKLSVNTHTTAEGAPTSLPEDLHSNLEIEGIDAGLAARYASLKGPHSKPTEKGKGSGNTKAEAKKGDVPASPQRASKAKEDTKSIARTSSQESDGTDSLDAELFARLQALKGPSLFQQGSEGESASSSGRSTNSASNTPSLTEQMQALKSRSKKPPQVSPGSPSNYTTSLAISSTSVGSSGWCTPTSPFKLMKALNMKKTEHPGSVPRSPSKSPVSESRETKKSVKKALSNRSKEDEEVDPSAMVADVQRLLAAVANEGRSERAQKSIKDTSLAGDKRAFFLKDRDMELLKAMEDEEAMTLEAEKVVEWAKDSVRLRGPENDSEDDLEGTDSEESDSGAGLSLKAATKKTKDHEDSDPEDSETKPKKRKGRRRWNFL